MLRARIDNDRASVGGSGIEEVTFRPLSFAEHRTFAKRSHVKDRKGFNMTYFGSTRVVDQASAHRRAGIIVFDAVDDAAGDMDTNRPRDLPLVASLEEHEQDRLSVDRPELHGPRLWVSLVFDEIGRASEQAVEAVGDPQPSIGAGETPHAIPVMAR